MNAYGSSVLRWSMTNSKELLDNDGVPLPAETIRAAVAKALDAVDPMTGLPKKVRS